MRVSVDGNIGAGKTRVVKALGESGHVTYLEPVEEWTEFLERMYTDPERWSTAFNINVLLSFAEHIHESKRVEIYERSPLSCMNVFCVLQHRLGYMTDVEMKLVKRIFRRIAWVPDIIIYLRTTPEVAFNRMLGRGRLAESPVRLEYISDVHLQYERFMAVLQEMYPTLKHITIDADRPADIVEEEVKYILSQHT